MQTLSLSPTASTDLEVGHKHNTEKALMPTEMTSARVASQSDELSVNAESSTSIKNASGGGLISSLSQLWTILGAPLRSADQWRMVIKPKYGDFHGNPQMSGLQIATDGCVMVLQNESGRVWKGHVTNFCPYPEESNFVSNSKSAQNIVSKPKAPSKALVMLLE